MKLYTRITIVEEVSPEDVDKMREAFENDTIKEDARVKTIEEMTDSLGIGPDDIMVAFKLEEEDE